ncbi:MAG TPA: division/cell wall cluster transcriptional repressor MraZ [Acidimicrobiales bacterium]
MATSTRFFGRYEHALDLKGRVILPAKLRTHFAQPGFLTPHLEGCLALWTNEEFDKEINLRLVEAENDPVARNRVRDWSAAVFEAEIDRQGRIAIPPSLRGYAGLEQEVLVIGMINRVELWSPASWANRDLGDAETQSERPPSEPTEEQVSP